MDKRNGRLTLSKESSAHPKDGGFLCPGKQGRPSYDPHAFAIDCTLRRGQLLGYEDRIF